MLFFLLSHDRARLKCRDKLTTAAAERHTSLRSRNGRSLHEAGWLPAGAAAGGLQNPGRFFGSQVAWVVRHSRNLALKVSYSGTYLRCFSLAAKIASVGIIACCWCPPSLVPHVQTLEAPTWGCVKCGGKSRNPGAQSLSLLLILSAPPRWRKISLMRRGNVDEICVSRWYFTRTF